MVLSGTPTTNAVRPLTAMLIACSTADRGSNSSHGPGSRVCGRGVGDGVAELGAAVADTRGAVGVKVTVLVARLPEPPVEQAPTTRTAPAAAASGHVAVGCSLPNTPHGRRRR